MGSATKFHSVADKKLQLLDKIKSSFSSFIHLLGLPWHRTDHPLLRIACEIVRIHRELCPPPPWARRIVSETQMSEKFARSREEFCSW